jgi:hypothetical protein
MPPFPLRWNRWRQKIKVFLLAGCAEHFFNRRFSEALINYNHQIWQSKDELHHEIQLTDYANNRMNGQQGPTFVHCMSK